MNTIQLELRLQITLTPSQVIQSFIDKTDWEAFWQRVDERVAPEIEAYRQARVRSRARAAEHWFL
jgi:hypothetical protein